MPNEIGTESPEHHKSDLAGDLPHTSLVRNQK
jgi:hypothetical protein